jgi:hypothetical protein
MARKREAVLKEGQKVTISICSQDAVDQFSKEMTKVLSIIGYLDALVTDESRVYDFFCSIGGDPEQEAEEKNTLEELSKAAHRVVTARDLLWEIARDIHLAETIPEVH